MKQQEFEFQKSLTKYHPVETGFERHHTGVKIRNDKQEDGWANMHRTELGNDHYLQDVDCMFGGVVFGQNTADRLFLEYIPDNYENRIEIIRSFAVVAMFDRKQTEKWAFSDRNRLSTALYLDICRTIATKQPLPPKFFFVIGKDEPPWSMIQIDIYLGEKISEPIILDKIQWSKIWESIGLKDLRNSLKNWIDP